MRRFILGQAIELLRIVEKLAIGQIDTGSQEGAIVAELFNDLGRALVLEWSK